MIKKTFISAVTYVMVAVMIAVSALGVYGTGESVDVLAASASEEIKINVGDTLYISKVDNNGNYTIEFQSVNSTVNSTPVNLRFNSSPLNTDDLSCKLCFVMNNGDQDIVKYDGNTIDSRGVYQLAAEAGSGDATGDAKLVYLSGRLITAVAYDNVMLSASESVFEVGADEADEMETFDFARLSGVLTLNINGKTYNAGSFPDGYTLRLDKNSTHNSTEYIPVVKYEENGENKTVYTNPPFTVKVADNGINTDITDQNGGATTLSGDEYTDNTNQSGDTAASPVFILLLVLLIILALSVLGIAILLLIIIIRIDKNVRALSKSGTTQARQSGGNEQGASYPDSRTNQSVRDGKYTAAPPPPAGAKAHTPSAPPASQTNIPQSVPYTGGYERKTTEAFTDNIPSEPAPRQSNPVEQFNRAVKNKDSSGKPQILGEGFYFINSSAAPSVAQPLLIKRDNCVPVCQNNFFQNKDIYVLIAYFYDKSIEIYPNIYSNGALRSIQNWYPNYDGNNLEVEKPFRAEKAASGKDTYNVTHESFGKFKR